MKVQKQINGKRMNLDLNLKSCTKINWKWIMDLNIKCEAIKLLKHRGKSWGSRVLRLDTKSMIHKIKN